jgi:hypothetical protein
LRVEVVVRCQVGERAVMDHLRARYAGPLVLAGVLIALLVVGLLI